MEQKNNTAMRNAIETITKHTSTRNLLNEVDNERLPKEVHEAVRKHLRRTLCCACHAPYKEEGKHITFAILTYQIVWWHTMIYKLGSRKQTCGK